MALEDMLQALEEEGSAECERVLSQAKDRAEEIIKEAKEEGVVVKKEHMSKIDILLKAERSRVMNEASFAVKKAIIKAKDSLIARTFDEISSEIGKIRGTPSYKEVFAKLASEALSNTKGKLVVSVDPKDAELAESVLKGMGVDYELRTDLQCCGGLTVTTQDGRVTYVNTLDSRLEKARLVLKSQVASVLFG